MRILPVRSGCAASLRLLLCAAALTGGSIACAASPEEPVQASATTAAAQTPAVTPRPIVIASADPLPHWADIMVRPCARSGNRVVC